jgi:hypothetical protein
MKLLATLKICKAKAFSAPAWPSAGTKHTVPYLSGEAATRCLTQRLSGIAKGRKARRSQRRLSRVAMVAASFIHRPGEASAASKASTSEHDVSIEPPQMPPQPGIAERAIDTAADVSRTITDVTTTLRSAVDRLSDAIAAARRPGQPLSTISAITREAPLASLFVAFLFGVAVARRR